MKNKIKLFILSASVVAFSAILSGCCHAEVKMTPVSNDISSRRIDKLQPVAVGEAYNTGYYLFNIWPIYSGNPEQYNRKDYHSFFDDINKGRNSSLLLNAMQRQYKVERLHDVEHQETSSGYFSLWIVWRKNIRTTALGLKAPEKVKSNHKNKDSRKKRRSKLIAR